MLWRDKSRPCPSSWPLASCHVLPTFGSLHLLCVCLSRTRVKTAVKVFNWGCTPLITCCKLSRKSCLTPVFYGYSVTAALPYLLPWLLRLWRHGSRPWSTCFLLLARFPSAMCTFARSASLVLSCPVLNTFSSFCACVPLSLPLSVSIDRHHRPHSCALNCWPLTIWHSPLIFIAFCNWCICTVYVYSLLYLSSPT